MTRLRRPLRLLPIPPRGLSAGWLLALGVALVLAIQPNWPDRTAITVAGVLALTLVAAARWQLRWLPVVVLVGCGLVLRAAMLHVNGSDVSAVTKVAILTVQYGGDPYGIAYGASRPPGAAFPYGPLALLWYLPSLQDPTLMEFGVSALLLVLFAIRAGKGRPLGLAVFALAPPIVLATMDGSNDTSAGLLILGALVLAQKRPVLGAVVLAAAVAFKPYAIAWLPPLVIWAGLPALVAFAAASLVAWSPVLFVWGPASYLRSLAMAQETHLRQAYWSLGAIVDGIAPGAGRVLETARYFLSGAIAVVFGRRFRSADGVIVVGTVVFLVAQFGGYFGSYVYLAAIAPILCWRLDDWLKRGLPEVMRAYAEVPDVARRLRGVRRASQDPVA
ncbi:MAG: hypothetical protein HYX55_04185 [Chloroflexi bacterium]|nr:hypothetical protein [Chloroflexota bacterium]